MSIPAEPSLDDLPVAEEWFAVEEVADRIWVITEPWLHPLLRANAYLIRGRTHDLLIDAGNGLASVRAALEERQLLRDGLVVVATHTHSDHIGGLHEFDTRLVHPAEANGLVEPELPTLWSADFGDEFLRWYEATSGESLPAVLADAVPSAGFAAASWRIKSAPPTSLLHDGAVLELGGRTLEVLHLPGHSPGQIGLFERSEGLLLTGDAIYDDVLLDECMEGTDIPAYIATMHRLLNVDVDLVLPGHGRPFGRGRLAELARGYLERRG